MTGIKKIFTGLGGTFLTSPSGIRAKYLRIKAILFDWDGVFNDGYKYGETGSLFSESDSMGINMLRFNYHLLHNKPLFTYIITGLSNNSAISFVKREHFHGLFLNYKHKEDALAQIRQKHGITDDEIAFVFDDVLDLGIAGRVALSFFVRRDSSPLTTRFVLDHHLCDYTTGSRVGNFAVREICELLMGVSGEFDQTLEKRIRFSGPYKEFYDARQNVEPVIDTHP